ncbi:MAG: NUDIX domain-containing protein [Candidatus Izemoplasmatales bacterium]|jgi:8-oxo-dGTP pyrophosphatase MutT (NUDIX family)|nr:NUDIX domain-containing protein [Candidatus Izemoplasmatales bacterium]
MDISIPINNMRFNFRVGAIIIKDDMVLIINNSKSDYYYTVGGRVHIGEDTISAVKREVFEETALILDVKKLLYINENFFQEGDTLPVHEISFYYLMDGIFDFSDLKCNSLTENKEEETLRWVPIDALDEVDLFPDFLCTVLKNIGSYTSHVISRQKKGTN